MPQLNPLDWGPQLVWLLLTFGVLYLLMVYVALPRIGSVIEARAARIAGDLARADKLRRETEEAIAAYGVSPFDDVDEKYMRLSMPVSCCSMTWMTVRSTTSALAPG